MAKAFTPFKEGKKLVFAARNLVVTPGSKIWPNATNVDDVEVLVGEYFCHDEWFPLRSSKVVAINGNDHETLNSIYRAIDKP